MNSKAWNLEDQKSFDRWENWAEEELMEHMNYRDDAVVAIRAIGAITKDEETEHERLIAIMAIISAYKNKYPGRKR